jgi:hypothetical protein
MEKYIDVSMDYDNKKWECYLCCEEGDWESLPFGYINNMHPLCPKCADEILVDTKHMFHSRLSYHNDVGDIILNI